MLDCMRIAPHEHHLKDLTAAAKSAVRHLSEGMGSREGGYVPGVNLTSTEKGREYLKASIPDYEYSKGPRG